MILVADSGSTKTDWVFIKEGQIVHQQETKGLNPNFVSKQWFLTELGSLPYTYDVASIRFFGAGCSSLFAQDLVSAYCKDVFTNANDILIQHDLLAACIASAADNNGIVGILGTGSNSCIYRNNKVEYSIGSHGYLLGDEGGGVHLGKVFLEQYLRNKLPKSVLESCKLNEIEILENIYKQEGVQSYLASFAKIIIQHRLECWATEIIHRCFQSYFQQQINHYTSFPMKDIYMVGSIASLLKAEFETVASANGFSVKNCVQKPIDGLVNYYLSTHE